MPIRPHNPRAMHQPQVFLLKLSLLCAMVVLVFAPASALAATAIPMCSVFGECVEAPIPEAPPTGGEVRQDSLRQFQLGPRLDRNQRQDNLPWKLQLKSLDPMATNAIEIAWDLQPIVTALGIRRPTTSSDSSQAVPREVFRPPCLAR